MPKIRFNKLIESINGRIGDMIFYEADGQKLSRAVPEITADRTDRQKANSARFLAAQKYAAKALADPQLKAAYKAACHGHQNPRNLAIRDAMRPPVVESISLDAYVGKPGQIVRVHATDDFQVTDVTVTIRGSAGELVEQGTASLSADDGDWRYTTTIEVPPGQAVSITAVARDHAGNTGEAQRWHVLPLG